jgi:hypothetical protein
MRVGAGGELENAGRSIRFFPPGYDMIFRALAAGTIYFSLIDSNKGYHQFGLTARSRKYTAFITEDGFYEFR